MTRVPVNKHLDFDARLRASYGLAGTAEVAHLSECAACSSAVTAMGRRRGEDSAPALPDAFWLRQQAEIAEAIAREAASPSLGFRPAAALALALLVLLATALLERPVAVPPARFAPAPAAPEDDDRFLEEVYGNLNRNELRPLSPLAMLVESPHRGEASKPRPQVQGLEDSQQ